MRIRLKKLLRMLIVVLIFGCMFLLYSVFDDIVNIKTKLNFSKLLTLTARHNSVVTSYTRVTVSKTNEGTTVVSPIKVHGDCLAQVVLPKLTPHDSWQHVDSNKEIYAFSAYMEGLTIRIIGAKTSKNLKLYCQLYYRVNVNHTTLKMVEASAVTIPEDHGRKYTAAHFFCPLPDEQKPSAVSLADRKCINASNIMRVNSHNLTIRRNFTVCVTPLNYRYNRAHELIEWIELNRILGADFFTFYNYTSGPAVNDVLNFYARQGLLEVIPWRLPMGVDTWPRKDTPVEIHYFGQLAASNECLRRNRDLTEYIVVIDLDEFIIPRAEAVVTWVEMMKKLPDKGAFIFCNTFFRKDWYDTQINFPNKTKAFDLKLTTLLKLDRESKISPHNSRSKYIVKTKAVEVLGIHNIWRMARNQSHHLVPTNVGLVHHYRNWENPSDKIPRTHDQVVLDKFGPVLIDSVLRTAGLLKKKSEIKI